MAIHQLKTAILFLALSVFAAPTLRAETLQSARYVGVLRHDAIGRDQLAKLELIVDQSGKDAAIKAILTMHFGDFKNSEYVAYHFNNVLFDEDKHTLRLIQADQDVSIVADHFADGVLEGTFSSSTQGRVGRISMRLNGVAQPTAPLLQPINGEYQGTCNKIETTLELFTIKSTADTSRVGNPFGFFQVVGQWGERESLERPRTVQSQFTRASYNYFTGEFDLDGRPFDRNCRLDGDTIDCEGCLMKRISMESRGRVFDYPVGNERLDEMQKPKDLPAAGTNADIAGEYRGYVYLEYIDTYQEASISLDTYDLPHASGEEVKHQISAVASLHFGSPAKGETLSYRFLPKEIPTTDQPPHFILDYLDKDVDPVIHVTSISKGVLKGIWYSQLFGRVGKFVLYKGGLPLLPAGVKIMQRVSSLYKSDLWDLDIHASLDRTPPNSDNPFSPLDFGGYLRGRDLTARIAVTGGSYDFYTGRIGIFGSDGRIVTGFRDAEGQMKLAVMSLGYGTLLTNHELSTFTRQE